MQIKSLSATAIKTFEQCPYKYFLTYSKYKRGPSAPHLVLGTVVHDVLCDITKRLSQRGGYPVEEDYDFIKQLFIDKAAENNLSDRSLFNDGLDMIVAFLDRYDSNEVVIDLENRFSVNIGKVRVTGAMDKVVELGPDTIGIIDYKTSRIANTSDEMATDIQLSLYDLIASKMYPKYSKRVLMLEMLRTGNRLVTYREDHDRQFMETYVQRLFSTIKGMKDEEFVAVPNRYCGWCDHKYICDVFKEYSTNPNLLVKPVETLSDDELIEEWDRLGNMKKAVGDRENELKVLLAERVRDTGTIEGDGKYIYSYQSTRTSYDTSKVLGMIPQEDWLSIIRVDNSKLKRYTDKRQDLKPAVREAADVGYTAPIFKIKSQE